MLLDTIAGLISDRVGCDKASITMESSFKELSIDSLDMFELMVSLEDAIGMRIELTEKVETVGELVRVIEGKMKESKDAV